MKYSRDVVFNYLDEYINNIKGQLDTYKTKNPLLKSYIFETFNEDLVTSSNGWLENSLDLNIILNREKVLYKQIDEKFFVLGNKKSPFGFLEIINNRFFVIYSIDNADYSDKVANNIVKNSSLVDSLWVSGKMFNSFLHQVKNQHHLNRYIKMNFEYQNIYNLHVNEGQLEYKEDYVMEEPTKISLSKEIGEITEHIDLIRKILPEFNSITSMRFPTLCKGGKGGHHFYYNGKVTNRSNNFMDHRHQIFETVNTYQKITEDIESNVWLDYELIKSPNNQYNFSFQGSPIVFKFGKRLKRNVFRNFIESTFPKGKEPFKILAEPQWISEERVHIYGVDLHLWQEVMMDLSLDEFTVFIPKGTCGNTVHRLATNFQKYLDPTIEIWIGNEKYENVINRNMHPFVGRDNFNV
ncbi:hypothetical protein [Bacillus sp. 123MFChir2]|uniref:hypothetical protein n=1 Tax=Bacillus sp. 123MFChir2 TaxID=1169144 RepID=UPI000362E93A|nr:hypothetical protein [Bacillus sp. 123MFChir2]